MKYLAKGWKHYPATNQQWRDNWEETFGKKEEPIPHQPQQLDTCTPVPQKTKRRKTRSAKSQA
jgi:hypothetical protein